MLLDESYFRKGKGVNQIHLCALSVPMNASQSSMSWRSENFAGNTYKKFSKNVEALDPDNTS